MRPTHVALTGALALLAGCQTHPLAANGGLADEAVRSYVERGPESIDELRGLLDHEDLRVRHNARTALGRITGQWGADGTGLIWRRDLESALAEAREDDRPVLLLHLFGKLDEEFC